MGGEKKELTIRALQQRTDFKSNNTENEVQEEEMAEIITKGFMFL